MAIVTLILGTSGTGKSTAMRELDPAQTLLIQALKKPVPFKRNGWGYLSKENAAGNIIVSDKSGDIINYMRRTKRPVIILDDFQYTMANEFMRRSDEKGYDKFTDIGRNAWEIMNAAAALPDHVRVYILSHTEETDAGKTKMKTLGKMLDDKVCLEGMVTIVLQTDVLDRDYRFVTQSNGRTTCKSPMGLFETDTIPNDLAAVDAAISDFYSLNAATA
jgi:hypothetical protein